ncbi:MAG: rRNA maturation RNase YbeY [Clostridia bacterium]|nr:rRNA maturation RNase YbeY [Clostridia bacterium]
MIINFYGFGKENKESIGAVLEKACAYTGQNSDCLELGIRTAGRQAIRELNNTTRGVDKVTDVLSFPEIEVKGKITPQKYKFDVTENGCVNIGDIVICMARMKEQAKEYMHSEERELCFLALHGFLHLLGYDHIEPADETKMLKAQRDILGDLV